MQMSIPDSYERPLGSLFQMNRDERKRFVRALRDVPATLDLKQLAVMVAPEAGLNDKDVVPLVRMLASLYVVAQDGGVTDVADGVCEAARASKKKTLQPKDGDWETFKADLADLLSCDDSLGVSAKAFDVMFQHEHVYCTARILTDVRPIFGKNVSTEPPAGVVVHMLKLSYHEGDKCDDFYVALDADDLKDLREVIDRAIRKEAALKSLLGKTGMRYLSVEAHNATDD